MLRSALIVDDSRTALMALSRLLKGQGIASDMVESGPEALDYLRSNIPGVIFLDHMMPGMDGFETLAAIKTNDRIAAIPVVMYTSKEGDAYMGEALVLGAIGVLQKPIDPGELEQILQRVDRLRPPQAVSATVRNAPAAGMPARPRAAVTGVIHVPAEFRTRAAITSDRADTSDDHAPRGAHALAKSAPTTTAWNIYLRRGLWALAMLFPAVWYFVQYQQAERAQQQLQRENQELRAQQAAERLAATQKETVVSPPAPIEAPRRTASETQALLDSIAWALNQHAQYGPQEEPLSDTRLAQLRELVARLAVAGFQGTIRLETHVGEFCMTRDERGEYRLPNDSQSINRCEVITYSAEQAVLLGQRQSPAFARYLAERRPSNRIQIAVVSHGSSRPLLGYPESASLLTAGDWNQVARLNQRVEVVLLPATP